MKLETGGIAVAQRMLKSSHRPFCDGAGARKGRALLATALLAAMPSAALAAIDEFVAGMTSSGTAPFSGACTQNSTVYTPGEDACGEDNVVRTHDSVHYQVGFSLTPQDSNARLVLEVPAAIYPGNYTGGGTPRVGYFHIDDLSTGPNGCQNVSPTPLTEPVVPGVSGVTTDGKKLYCAQPTPISANSLPFAMRIDGDAPNGSTQPAPRIMFESDNNPANSNPTPVSGNHAGIDLYGMGDVVVSSAPRWDAVKDQLRGALYVPGSGPNGEDGYVFSWNIGIKANGSIKGLEALREAAWVEDYSDLNPIVGDAGSNDFPNARLVTWPIVNAFANADITTLASNGNSRNCGDWHSQLGALGNSFDNHFFFPMDQGNVDLREISSVARGGECVMTPGSDDQVNRTARFELINTDFSLNHYPRRKSSDPSSPVLVDPLNPDSSSNEYWVASKTILVWAPLSDVVIPPTGGIVLETLSNRIQFSGTSVTGQGNIDPVAGNDASAQNATRALSGDFNKFHAIWRHDNPEDWDVITQSDPNQPGDSWVNQAAPGQYFSIQLYLSNTGTERFASGHFCDKLDNARLSFVDTTSTAFTSIYAKDPGTGILYHYSAGAPSDMPVTIQLGVGGSGITDAPSAGGTAANGSGTWTSMTIPDSEYTGTGRLPADTGTGTMALSGCGDADARWFNSVADLTAAGYTVQDVSRVRGSYPHAPAGVTYFMFIPVRARDSVQWDTHISDPGQAFVPPGNPVAAGSSTIDSFTTNHALWLKAVNDVSLVTDTVRIFQTQYARISKSSPSHASGSQVTPGSRVTYDLQVNLSTTGSEHAATVWIYDVLPAHMSYIAGSTTLGGVAFDDPTCVDGPAAWPVGWGSPSAASEDIPVGFSACRWELTGQIVRKLSVGDTGANLPLLRFQARVLSTAPNTVQLFNTSFADSQANLLHDARYAGADAGFACVSGEVCASSDWLLHVSASTGALVSKSVIQDVVTAGSGFEFILEYGAIGSPLTDFRIVDVFPYNGDGRVPASSFQGTLGLAGPVSGTAIGVGGTPDDTNVIALYTSNAPANINPDPFDAGHVLDGSGSNSATQTNWCATVGGANCPASWGDVRAVYIRAKGGAQAVLNGEVFSLRLLLQPQANQAGDVYTNGYMADSPRLLARRPGSNHASVRVTAPDLVIEKTVTPTSGVMQGSNVQYTLAVRNSAGNPANPDVGPFESGAITVTDPLPAGLTVQLPVTSTGWDCTASTATQLSCSYTGSYPIPVNAAVGSPVVFEAQVSSLNNQPTARFTNTATVATPAPEVDATNNSDDASFDASATPPVTGNVQPSISKTVNVSQYDQGAATPVVYTIVVGNVGADGGNGFTVIDTPPSGVAIGAWTCAVTNAGTAYAGVTTACGAASGTGTLNTTVDLQPGAIVTFTVNAMIEATAAGTLTNRAQVNAPSGVCVSGCTQDSTASVRSNRADPYLIPANNPLALLGLALLMMLGAGFGLRQSRR